MSLTSPTDDKSNRDDEQEEEENDGEDDTSDDSRCLCSIVLKISQILTDRRNRTHSHTTIHCLVTTL